MKSGINKDFPEKSTDWIATDDGKRCTDVLENPHSVIVVTHSLYVGVTFVRKKYIVAISCSTMI